MKVTRAVVFAVCLLPIVVARGGDDLALASYNHMAVP